MQVQGNQLTFGRVERIGYVCVKEILCNVWENRLKCDERNALNSIFGAKDIRNFTAVKIVFWVCATAT